MTLDDLQQRIKKIGAPYKSDREKRARRLFIEERAAALKGHRGDEFEIKSKIAARLNTPYSAISFAGSAQLGFSVIKESLFLPKISDLDVACVSTDVFQQAWTDVNQTTKAFTDLSVFGGMPAQDVSIFTEQILKRGMIRIEVMPNSSLSKRWKMLESELSRSYSFLFKSVSIAVYINEYAFVGSKIVHYLIWTRQDKAMLNDLKYTVRSREIVDLVSAMRSSRLSLSPYFQRNLVWRDSHKKDFIDTILKGYPFPQIFLSRGPINLETMEAMQAVVDGQQRLNTIRDFVTGKLDVGGKYFQELSAKQREDFLKYEVPVIDFDLDAGDPRLKDVFHRLNRTYYSLSSIEKLASEYSASEFMLVARVLSGEIRPIPGDFDEEELSAEDGDDASEPNPFSRDPGIDDETWEWLSSRASGSFSTLLEAKPVFSKFEFDRKVPLMFTLNVMSTFLAGYYGRNDRIKHYLNQFASDFPEKNEVLNTLNGTADYVSKLCLTESSVWWNKANFFSLVCELARYPAYTGVEPEKMTNGLSAFEQKVPKDYALAAREAVNSKNARELRGKYVREVFEEAAI